jgi:hypothetical protein
MIDDSSGLMVFNSDCRFGTGSVAGQFDMACNLRARGYSKQITATAAHSLRHVQYSRAQMHRPVLSLL